MRSEVELGDEGGLSHRDGDTDASRSGVTDRGVRHGRSHVGKGNTVISLVLPMQDDGVWKDTGAPQLTGNRMSIPIY